MKLATLKDDRLVLVSRDLRVCVPAADIAASLIDAVARWQAVEPALQARSLALNAGELADAQPFDATLVRAPIPRAPQWLDGSAFENHGRLMEKAFGLPPADYSTHPLMYQGNSDDFIGARDDVVVPSEADGIDLEGELGVVVGDVAMGCAPQEALSHVRLFVLINDVSLRSHAPREMKTGFGWIQAKPCTAFAPVAVTPDELGAAWADARVALDMRCERNGEPIGRPNGRGMSFGFDRLIAYAAYSRRLRAGTIIGSGTFSAPDRAVGSACLSEVRAIEMIDHGEPRTPFLRHGERIRIDMQEASGQSIFGAIDQRIVARRAAA